jgi:hypothetical protein
MFPLNDPVVKVNFFPENTERIKIFINFELQSAF